MPELLSLKRETQAPHSYVAISDHGLSKMFKQKSRSENFELFRTGSSLILKS